MDLTTAIIVLVAGISVFIVGMKLLSGGLTKSAGKGIKNLFKKFQNNRVIGAGVGAATTAIIQSSDATSVMVVGFINAGAMNNFQGLAIILGAYLGTTITGILVSLSSIGSITLYFTLFAFIGVVMMFFKNELIKSLGEVFTGLGLLFLGLELMKYGFQHQDVVAGLSSMFGAISFPLLLFVIGIIITGLIQSSSATIGVVIIMVGASVLSLDKGLIIAIGATIGSVTATIIATIGGSTNSKRVAASALFVRVTYGLVWLVILWVVGDKFGSWVSGIFNDNVQMALAIFMVFYNIILLIMYLPLITPINKLSEKFIKDKAMEKQKKSILYIDDKLLNSPDIALEQVKKEIEHMATLAKENLDIGYHMMIDLDFSKENELLEREESIDYINNVVTDFLINLSPRLDAKKEAYVGGYFHVVNDIERIGDHAINFHDMAKKMSDDDLEFSLTAKDEFAQMYAVVLDMYDMSIEFFDHEKSKGLKLNKLHELEAKTDVLKDELSSKHYERLKDNKCKVELSPFYSSLVSELERIADHLTNIGYSVISPTGDDPEDYKY